MATDDRLDGLIHSVDLDGLVRLVDERCSDGDWEGLLRLRDRCAAATRETGRQLWPAATLAEYRLALLAPSEWAATVLDGESGRFTIGPLSEVAAQLHTWAELSPHLAAVPVAMLVAHERAIRGEDVDPSSIASLPPVLDIPASMQPWEPRYAVPTYSDVGVEQPELAPVGPAPSMEISSRGEPLEDDTTELAVRQLVEPWTTSSTGRAEATCVEGRATDAIAALGLRSIRMVEIPAADAIARLAWAGASGGAQGRRRGTAMGRFSAWWLLGAIGDLHDDWPPTNDDIETLLGELTWYRWDAHEPEGGWRLQLAIENLDEGVAWAINATDQA